MAHVWLELALFMLNLWKDQAEGQTADRFKVQANAFCQKPESPCKSCQTKYTVCQCQNVAILAQCPQFQAHNLTIIIVHQLSDSYLFSAIVQVLILGKPQAEA